MAASFWRWLMFSDAGLLARICVGVCILGALALWDIRRRAKEAQRWREYLFIVAAVAAATAFALVNDQITVTISWEYFYYAKGLADRVGYQTPPDLTALRWAAAGLAVKAAWTAGLVLGVAYLLANNPRRDRPRLSYGKLYELILLPLLGAAALGSALGIAGYLGLLGQLFGKVVELEADRLSRFTCVWGVHLGVYVGAALGTAAAVWRILRLRGRTDSR